MQIVFSFFLFLMLHKKTYPVTGGFIINILKQASYSLPCDRAPRKQPGPSHEWLTNAIGILLAKLIVTVKTLSDLIK